MTERMKRRARTMKHFSQTLTIALMALTATLLSGCGGDSAGGGRLDLRAPIDGTPTGDLTLSPARADSEYASVLADCARPFNRGGDNEFDACRLGQLPLLGQEHDQVTVDDVLERTLVSHDWMANRFEQALTALPDDLLQLFSGVTAVVIGADIRPSYYWLATGSIYLDPAYLWLTIEERDTISREPDFRSGFDRELNFESLARFVKGGDYAWSSAPLSGPGDDRTLEQILAPMSALLFHELAHANDYIPPAEHANLNSEWTVAEAAIQLESDSVSATLASTYPLSSTLMMDLAEVSFQGRDATEAEKQLTPQEVGLEFAGDIATDAYAYVSSGERELFFEDTAMLFEEAMMQHYFGITREVAFTDRPEGDEVFCDDYIVLWGERGRAGNEQIRPRLALILPLLLDHSDTEPYLASLPESEPMTNNLGWCANLSPSAMGLHTERDGQWREPLPVQDQRHGPGHPHSSIH